ncbi:MAG: ATP-binding protein, partial [Richelia sp. RM1_1_1]|nr:ATP-binding protein [Richelia sp. RM1_1_1]
MTNFNPDGNFKEIEQWEDLAELKASNTGIVPRVIGGTVAGVFGLTFGIELVGGVAAAWLFKTAWDSFRKSGSKLTLVRNNGCNAFVLDEQNFRAYTKQFGDEAVLQELQFVKDSNIELTGFAASWFRSKTKSLPASQTVEVIPTVIPETSISMEKESIVSDSFTATANPNEYAWIDQILKLPFRTITGKQGSGKSTLERFLISELKKAGFHVIIINPEVNPDKFKGVEVLQTVTQINDFLDEFVNLI